jgi:hypothetical protein
MSECMWLGGERASSEYVVFVVSDYSLNLMNKRTSVCVFRCRPGR